MKPVQWGTINDRARLIAIACLGLAIAMVGVFIYKDKQRDELITKERFAEQVKSEGFKKLTPEDKFEIIQRFMADQFTLAIQNYQALTDREKMLFLDQFLERVRNMAEQQNVQQSEIFAKMFKRVESLKAEDQANYQRFFKDLRQRMQQQENSQVKD